MELSFTCRTNERRTTKLMMMMSREFREKVKPALYQINLSSQQILSFTFRFCFGVLVLMTKIKAGK